MCDYSVMARPREEKARRDEELVLVNLADHSIRHVVRGFASPMNLHEPVCMLPGTKLRCIGTQAEQQSLVLPFQGQAEFVQTDLHDPNTTHDALMFEGNRLVKLVELQAGMQVRVVSVPTKKGGERRLAKLVQTPFLRIAEPRA